MNHLILISLLLFQAAGAEPATAHPAIPATPALIGLDADAVLHGVDGSDRFVGNATIEQCGAQLVVEDGWGRRITVPRGKWVAIDNGCRKDLIWYCGTTQEISRGVRGKNVLVFNSANSRQIDIRW